MLKFCLKRPLNLFKYSYTFSSLKDSIFTVAILGKPNVGKSTLFNTLSQQYTAITDPMPGLTRDRKEFISKKYKKNYILAKILGVPIRLVDTAGFQIDPDENKKINLANLAKRRKDLEKDKEIIDKMMDQTQQALIYADLALFLIDIRGGIDKTDKELANWLRKNTNFQKKSRNLLNLNENQEIFDKKIVLIGNKAENEYEDIDYEEIFKIGFNEPLLISAEHGDGLHELLSVIKENLPENYIENYEEKKKKRIERHLQYRKALKDEIEEFLEKKELEEEFLIKEWEKEFDSVNKNPEENSDLDSDKEGVLNVKETMKYTVPSGDEEKINSDNFYKKHPINLCVVGKPNVGKSSLVNNLLKDNRVIVDDLPGTTRDSISIQWFYKGKKIKLIDTAGIEKKVKTMKKNLEKKINSDVFKSIAYSNVCICLIDAMRAFRTQDFVIKLVKFLKKSVANHILNEGRALVLAVNKWDLIPEEYREKAKKYMEEQIFRNLNIKSLKLHYLSAKKGLNLSELMDSVLTAYERWNTRISTGLLNDWLSRIKKVHPLPSSNGEQLKIRFISQIKSRPPTFVIFVNNKELCKDNYLKFLQNKICEEFNLFGVTTRIIIRGQEYKDAKKKLEKEEKKKIKEFFLKRKKVALQAQKKLESLMKEKKNKEKKNN